MANASTMVLKNGFVSRLSIWRETKADDEAKKAREQAVAQRAAKHRAKAAAAQKLPR